VRKCCDPAYLNHVPPKYKSRVLLLLQLVQWPAIFSLIYEFHKYFIYKCVQITDSLVKHPLSILYICMLDTGHYGALILNYNILKIRDYESFCGETWYAPLVGSEWFLQFCLTTELIHPCIYSLKKEVTQVTPYSNETHTFTHLRKLAMKYFVTHVRNYDTL
jgi:hypothetical protein